MNLSFKISTKNETTPENFRERLIQHYCKISRLLKYSHIFNQNCEAIFSFLRKIPDHRPVGREYIGAGNKTKVLSILQNRQVIK